MPPVLAAEPTVGKDLGLFERVHRLPASSGDVEDDPSIGLVIFGPDRAFSKKAKSTAEAAALEFLGRRGTTARIHKNSLVFLAPEVDRLDVLISAVRNRMAWEYILENKGSLNLDQHNTNLATSRVAQAKQTVGGAIRETYRWILVPHQEPGQADIQLEPILINGEGTLAARVTKKADAGEFVVRTFSPSLLRMEINRLQLWKSKPYVQVDALAGYFTQYVYMPKVVRPKVVLDAIRHLDEVLNVAIDGFAYADAYEKGRFVGLTVKAPSDVRGTGLLVDPEVALVQIEADTPAAGPTTKPSQTGAAAAGPSATPTATGPVPGPVAPPPLIRFHATKQLSPGRVVRDASQIYEEIVSHFVSADVSIRVTLDLESDALDRLSEDQRTAIRENLRTLGFAADDWSMD